MLLSIDEENGEESSTGTGTSTGTGAVKIPVSMWIASCLIGMSSFLFGFSLASLNSCLVFGDSNSASACYNDNDSSCPIGTIYDDMDLSTCN